MIEEMTLSIPIDADSQGYIDQECPECLFLFKIFEDDWDNRIADGEIHCPLCGHTENADSFLTTDQINNSEKQAENYIANEVENLIMGMFNDMAKNINRNQKRNSSVRISMEVKNRKKKTIIVPIKAQKEMQLKVTCENCGTRYAVVGSGYFCPCCGHNSVRSTFNDSLKKIEAKISNIEFIKQSMESEDEAELITRSLVESGLSDCVVSFQRYCEEMHKEFTNNKKIKFNLFQRIEDGNNEWKETLGFGYDDWITENEFIKMNKLFQQRHLLQHKEGMVDQKYLDKSNDSVYRIGQRIVVKQEEVIELKSIIEKLVKNIEENISNS